MDNHQHTKHTDDRVVPKHTQHCPIRTMNLWRNGSESTSPQPTVWTGFVKLVLNWEMWTCSVPRRMLVLAFSITLACVSPTQCLVGWNLKQKTYLDLIQAWMCPNRTERTPTHAAAACSSTSQPADASASRHFSVHTLCFASTHSSLCR